MTVNELYARLNAVLPPVPEPFGDSDGAQCVPEPDREVRRVLVALDPYTPAIDAAIAGKYDLLLTHHPVIYGEYDENSPAAAFYRRLYGAGIAAFSFHVRLDIAPGGVNDILAGLLGLSDIVPFGTPELPVAGRIGTLAGPLDRGRLAAFVRDRLGAAHVRYNPSGDGKAVRRVAVVGGAGADFITAAAAAGADAFVSGEFKYHVFGYAAQLGICALEAGHYHTETPVCGRLRELALEADPSLTVDIIGCDPAVIL